MSAGRLQGKVAIVTGAGNGIGRGCALRFAEEGASVVVVARQAKNGTETVEKIEAAGGRARLVVADMQKMGDICRMVEETLATFGQINVLVANAGVQKVTPFLEISESEFDWVVDTNLKGTFFCGQLVARELARAGRGGSIINMGSVQSEVAVPGLAHYGSTKGAIRNLTKVMALELAPKQIRVNGIGPGPIHTGLPGPDEEWLLSRVPLGRIGEPIDVANAALFLASDESSWVTGIMLYVDGGWLIQ